MRIQDIWKGGPYVKKGVGFALLIFLISLLILLIFLKYPMKMKAFCLIETIYFHFHRIFKNEEGGSSEPTELHLDPPLH